jgi:capsular exopolysaccharide synthesis family protein
MIEPQDAAYGDIASSNRNSKVPWAVRLQQLKRLSARYWWIVALTVVVGLGIQAQRTMNMPVQYVSNSRMMVSGHLSLPQGEVYSDELSSFYGTQVALMKSRQTVIQAMDRVRAIHPEVPVDENADTDAALELRTSIFDLRVTASNPDYAKLLLDAVMDTYLSSKRGRKNQTTDQAVSAITEEISYLDSEIRNDEQQLLDFQKENNVVFIEEQSNNSATYLVGLNNDLARLTRERDLLAMESTNLPQGMAPPPVPGTTPDGGGLDGSTNAAPAGAGVSSGLSQGADTSILTEQENIEKLKIQRDQYAVYLKDKHPKMVALQEAIDQEQKFLEMLQQRNAASQDAGRANLDLQIKNLQQQIADWNKKSLDLSERLATYQQIKSKLAREQTLYDQLASSIQSVDLNKSLDQENIVIMEAASNAMPVKPDLAKQMIIGGAVGFLIGLVIVYFVHRLDDKIDSSMEFSENVEFPLIGQIPLVAVDKKSKRVPLLTGDDKRHTLVESYRNIRSALLFRSSDMSKPRSLLVTSTVPGEGKSTFASNLAIIFAYSGAKVLLIDADMRRGVVHTLFNAELSPGLSDYLQQQISWQDTLRATHLPNLHIIPRGKVPQHAGDLLLNSLTDALLQESIAHYDLVLWDSAPLFAADDAANLCSRVDGILFMARVRYSTINSVRMALEELAQRNARITGVVLNGVRSSQPGYYDRYRYKDYYVPVAES